MLIIEQVFAVIYCFPFVQPVTAQNMNYASLTTGGLTIFVYVWWLVRGGRYIGPKAMVHFDEDFSIEGHGESFEMVAEGKA